MVKFGRHLQFFLECEEPQCSHYVVPYNQLRDKIYTCTTPGDVKSFELSWREALQKASDDFRESTNSCWSNVFESISKIQNARGAPLESALKLYPPTMGVTASRDLLCFLKGISSTASLNSEGLRKLVKKFDKQGSASLSAELLPELYSSNFHMGLDALDMAIQTLRELLDDLDECDNELYDHFQEEKKLNHAPHISRLERPLQNIIRNQSYENEEIIIGKRANEMLWLRDMIRQIPEDYIKHAVAHRGFHNPKGRSDLRPLENSLAAFEAAWTNGIHLCECDVAVTKDEKLVLAHDSDFSRLSLDPSSDTSNRKVSDLTFKELIALTLKNGVRAPLLLDVLRSAHTIGPEAKLIIEIKPGNNQAAMALARLLARYPEYVTHVAVIMSFDLWAMHELRSALEKMLSGEPRRISSYSMLDMDGIEKGSFPSNFGVKMPKLMLLTVAHVPADNYELWVDCNDYSPIDGWLQTDGSCLDGVYVRFENEMLEPDGAAELKALCKKYTVGVWGVVNKDPDDYETMCYLVKECGVSYFNTDLPRTFLTSTQFEDN